MAGDITYYDDNATRVLNLMRDTFGAQFKAYYDGSADPQSFDLPCLVVTNLRGTVNLSATSTDDITEEIMIILIRSLLDDAGASVDTKTTEFILRKQILGQDPLTKQYLPVSILGALRSNITLSDSTVQSQLSYNFSQTYRGSIEVLEAYVTLSTTRKVIVTPRS